MLSFEVTAIDLILVMAVIVLFLFYVTKLVNSPEHLVRKSFENGVKRQNFELERNTSFGENKLGECPRGFGIIKGVVNGNSISDRCLSCYKLSECYVETEEIEV